MTFPAMLHILCLYDLFASNRPTRQPTGLMQAVGQALDPPSVSNHQSKPTFALEKSQRATLAGLDGWTPGFVDEKTERKPAGSDTSNFQTGFWEGCEMKGGVLSY